MPARRPPHRNRRWHLNLRLLLVVEREQIEVAHRCEGLHDLGQADKTAPERRPRHIVRNEQRPHEERRGPCIDVTRPPTTRGRHHSARCPTARPLPDGAKERQRVRRGARDRPRPLIRHGYSLATTNVRMTPRGLDDRGSRSERPSRSPRTPKHES